MKKKRRYPGTRPFKNADRELFFGRDVDVKGLSNLIAKEKLVVLVGRSGVGKTSLLNAGVIPKLIEQHKHSLLNIHLEEHAINPLALLVQHLENFTNDSTFLTKKFNIASELPKDHAAKLWYYTKIIQQLHKDYQDKAVTLVFDHFEELFIRYPNDVDSFSQLMATMLNFETPKSVHNFLSQKVNADPDYFSDDELKQLLEPLNLKIVISVRSDYMGELNRLKKFLPEIFNYTYELLPLNGPQVLDAIEKPAQVEGDYFSPLFKYSRNALERILKGLLDSENNGVESFQLQLIGEYAEETIKKKEDKNPETTEFHFTDKDLGRLDTIWENHYKKIIDGLPLGKSRQNLFKDPLKPKNPITVTRKILITRRQVKEFIENALIVGGNRVPIDKGTIESKYKIPENILDWLEKKYLIESFLNTVGIESYQLRYDSLIAPILKSAEKRRKKELKWLLLAALFFLMSFLITFFWPEPRIQPPPDLEPSLDLEYVIHPCSPDNKFQVNIMAMRTDEDQQEKKECNKCKVTVIHRTNGDTINPQSITNIYQLLKGEYDIYATDTTGSITKDYFNLKEMDCEIKLSPDYLPIKPSPDTSITANAFTLQPIIGPLSFDSTTLIGESKVLGVSIADVGKEKNWFHKLRAIKDEMKNEPCESSKVRNWRFNDNEAHLIGVRLIQDSAQNESQDSLLLVLLVADRVFPYKSITPKLKEECMLRSQKRYDLRESLHREILYKDSLSLVSKRFKNPAGDTDVHIRDNEYNDPYYIIFEKILKEKGKPKIDEIYFTFVDEEYFDLNDRIEIENVFQDPKTEYLYLPIEM